MFENYWLGAGDQQLSADRFRSISGAAAALNPLETLQLSPDLIRKQFGFYNNREYDYGLGIAFLFYNRRGDAVGFYDHYNFNAQPLGERPYDAEAITRGVGFLGSLHGARNFELTYGVFRRPDSP